MPEIRLATLPGGNAARRLLPSTVALLRLALQAGPQALPAASAVAAARSLLRYRLVLHLKAEDLDDARLCVCWLLRHLHTLLVFMEKQCLAVAPDHSWTQAEEPEARTLGLEREGVLLIWQVGYARDCTQLQVVVEQLQDRFHTECSGVALWHAMETVSGDNPRS